MRTAVELFYIFVFMVNIFKFSMNRSSMRTFSILLYLFSFYQVRFWTNLRKNTGFRSPTPNEASPLLRHHFVSRQSGRRSDRRTNLVPGKPIGKNACETQQEQTETTNLTKTQCFVLQFSLVSWVAGQILKGSSRWHLFKVFLRSYFMSWHS